MTTVPVVRFTVAGEETHDHLVAPTIGEPGRRYTVIYDGHCKVCGRMVKMLRKEVKRLIKSLQRKSIRLLVS